LTDVSYRDTLINDVKQLQDCFMAKTVNRRGFIKKSLVASAGLTLAAGHKEHILLARSAAQRTDEQTPVRQKSTNIDMPMGRIRHLEISRLICGGNLIIGSAHDRDLIYVASLMRHYSRLILKPMTFTVRFKRLSIMVLSVPLCMEV